MPPEDIATVLTIHDAAFVNETIHLLFARYQTFLSGLLRCIYQSGLFTEQIAARAGQPTRLESTAVNAIPLGQKNRSPSICEDDASMEKVIRIAWLYNKQNIGSGDFDCTARKAAYAHLAGMLE
jgi:hypothetical protein